MWSFKVEKLKPYTKKVGGAKKGAKAANSKRCALVDVDGNILKKYKTAKEASLDNSCDHSSVVKVCNSKLNSVKGLFFIYI